MPVRIEELVFKTTIKADKKEEQASSFDKNGLAQPDIRHLRENLLQDLVAITNERLAEAKER